MNIIALFCEIDDFFLAYEKWKPATHCLPRETPPETRGRPRKLHPSEVMTLLIAFHESGYRAFKHFYLKHVCVYWRAEFPHLVSYGLRFVQLQEEVLTLLTLYLSAHLGTCSGISFVDSTRLRVCDNKRISSHRVFSAAAERSKTSMGWFYGFKLHLLINDKGEILDVALTPGNTDLPQEVTVDLCQSSPRGSTGVSTRIEGISRKTFGRCSVCKTSTSSTKFARTWIRWSYRFPMRCC